jgi:hypothetical protein
VPGSRAARMASSAEASTGRVDVLEDLQVPHSLRRLTSRCPLRSDRVGRPQPATAVARQDELTSDLLSRRSGMARVGSARAQPPRRIGAHLCAHRSSIWCYGERVARVGSSRIPLTEPYGRSA